MDTLSNLSPGMLSLLAAATIAIIPILALFGIPAVWHALGSLAGTYLRRKTDGRRTKILQVIEEDEKQYAKKQGKSSQDPASSKGEEDRDGEKAQAHPAESAPDGNKQAENWSGIVGFFHPFWYVL